MNPLPFRPLSSVTREESRNNRLIRSQGFVDEEVVSGMIARGAYERLHMRRVDLVLSSSEHDYAGWALPVAPALPGISAS
jgi:hypothetical protein